MTSKILILLLTFFIFNCFALKHTTTSKKFLSGNCHDCDFKSYSKCDDPKYIINRATGFYLGRGEAYNTNGLDAVLDYNYDKWCVSKCFITNTVNNLVLDVSEADLEKKHVILWPIHSYDRGNQVWTIGKETTGFSSIRTETLGSKLALASVDSHDPKKGLTLADYDIEDPRQQWTIQE